MPLSRFASLALPALLLTAFSPALHALPVPTQGVRPQLATADTGGDAMARGVQALSAGRNAEAQTAFEAAQRANPRAAEPLLGLAELALRRKSEGEALNLLLKAQQLAPQRADVLTALGRVHLLRRQPEKAEPVLREAVKLDAKGLAPRLLLADLLASRGDLKAALPLLQQAQALQGDNAAVLLGLGGTQLRLGARAEGERLLRRVAAMEPKNPAPWMMLAQSAADPASGVQLCDEVLKRAPERADALLLRAHWQAHAKDLAGARDSLQRAAKADPKSAAPWLRLGLLDEAGGRRADAKRHYLAAIERDAHEPVALNNLVMMGLADGDDPARLELMARRALKALPDNAAVHDTLARTLRARKDKKGALAAASEAVRLNPKDPSTQLLLAELQQWNGDRAAAKKSAEQVLALQTRGEAADKAKALLTQL